MNRRTLGFSNDSVCSDSLLLQCEHGQSWSSCANENCREIGRLYWEQLKEEYKEQSGREHAKRAQKNRGKKKSEFEIGLETTPAASPDDYETDPTKDDELEQEPTSAQKTFRCIFPDEIALRAAVQFKAVTLRQALLLEAYFDSDEGVANYKRWDAIGKKIGFSGRTVEREFRAVVEKFLKTKKTTGEPKANIEVVHVRGKRRPRYYRKHSLQFGEWKREWTELITDPKIIRKLREENTPLVRSDRTPIPSSPVNRLFAALIKQFASDLPKDEPVRPQDVSASDWEFNRRRAQRLLAGRKHLTGPWTAAEVAKKLVRGGRLCGGCRTYLIRGFRINGRKITRAREYCDDACKMRAERRKKKMAMRKSQNATTQK